MASRKRRKSAELIYFPSPERAYLVVLEELHREFRVLLAQLLDFRDELRRAAIESRRRHLRLVKAPVGAVDGRLEYVGAGCAPANDVPAGHIPTRT
jgi:hypothetical protein